MKKLSKTSLCPKGLKKKKTLKEFKKEVRDAFEHILEENEKENEKGREELRASFARNVTPGQEQQNEQQNEKHYTIEETMERARKLGLFFLDAVNLDANGNLVNANMSLADLNAALDVIEDPTVKKALEETAKQMEKIEKIEKEVKRLKHCTVKETKENMEKHNENLAYVNEILDAVQKKENGQEVKVEVEQSNPKHYTVEGTMKRMEEYGDFFKEVMYIMGLTPTEDNLAYINEILDNVQKEREKEEVDKQDTSTMRNVTPDGFEEKIVEDESSMNK
ncbi:MAG: hypothetical protein LBH47_01650 [Christensenellaceae bacterium]|jgi:hypothetical protein|nr:hypothetical protein [Christensenellaceae bacterium]